MFSPRDIFSHGVCRGKIHLLISAKLIRLKVYHRSCPASLRYSLALLPAKTTAPQSKSDPVHLTTHDRSSAMSVPSIQIKAAAIFFFSLHKRRKTVCLSGTGFSPDDSHNISRKFKITFLKRTCLCRVTLSSLYLLLPRKIISSIFTLIPPASRNILSSSPACFAKKKRNPHHRAFSNSIGCFFVQIIPCCICT